MPIPAVLNNHITYGWCWTGVLNVGVNARNPGRAGGMVTKNFHAYVENYEQSAHDTAMAGYVRQLGGNSRPPHRAQVVPANNNLVAPLTYYATHGQVSSTLAAAEMQQKWTAAATATAAANAAAAAATNPRSVTRAASALAASNATVFTVGQAHQLTVQGVRQPNGFHYEITMWYDVGDVYVAFHCYHP
jgi:hypothetical protein